MNKNHLHYSVWVLTWMIGAPFPVEAKSKSATLGAFSVLEPWPSNLPRCWWSTPGGAPVAALYFGVAVAASAKGASINLSIRDLLLTPQKKHPPARRRHFFSNENSRAAYCCFLSFRTEKRPKHFMEKSGMSVTFMGKFLHNFPNFSFKGLIAFMLADEN